MSEPIIFWFGCNVLRHGDIIHSCLDILRALGFDPLPVGGPDYCCGTVKDANQTTAGGMATRTVGRFNALQRERLVGALRGLSPGDRGRVFTRRLPWQAEGEERWAPRKVVRRVISHERFHTAEIQQRLAWVLVGVPEFRLTKMVGGWSAR